MATELAVRQQNDREGGDALRRWRCYHVFYHADRDLLLRCCLWPLIAELTSRDILDHFYFVRYSLGGPHLRIRWRLKSEDLAEAAEERMAARLADFFRENPSPHPIPAEQILTANCAIAGSDGTSGGQAGRVYPDCSWQRAAPEFEFQRYGGGARIGFSLSLFCLSSLSVLKLLCEHAVSPRQWVMTDMLRYTLQLAWGMAQDEAEFDRLLAYGSVHWGARYTGAVQRGDEAFNRQDRRMLALVSAELESMASGSAYRWPSLVEGGALLAVEIVGLTSETRCAVASSHIHMTANRLGLLNTEEAYVSRILMLSVDLLRRESPDVWLRMWQRRPAMLARVSGGGLDITAQSVLGEQGRNGYDVCR